VKILFLVTDDWYFLSHRLHLARGVRDAGGEVVVATSGGEGVGVIEEEGFAFRPVRFRRTLAGQFLNLALIGELTALYRRERPDIVHHVSFLPQVYGSLAAARAGVPAVVNAVTGLGHAFSGKNGKNGESGRRSFLRWGIERGYGMALRRPNVRALFQNDEDRSQLVKLGLVPEERTSCIPGSGVDTDHFRPEPEPTEDPPTILHASRMLWSKGVGDSVEASRELERRGVSHRLILAGRTHPTNPEAISEAQLGAWEREGIAEWFGNVGRMRECFARSHVVLLPTLYREGVPMVLLEAASCARPIVATDVPGCRDVVKDGVSGRIVPRNSPRQIADALEELLGDAALRRRMGEAGRRHVVAGFSKEIVVERTLEIYRSLLLGRRSER
jgi:glycosyltransferase involved in cell wall biosynthesis